MDKVIMLDEMDNKDFAFKTRQIAIPFRPDGTGNEALLGVLAFADKPNPNGFIYPLSVLEKIKNQINDSKEYVFLTLGTNNTKSFKEVAATIQRAFLENGELYIFATLIPEPILNNEGEKIGTKLFKNSQTLLDLAKSGIYGFHMACIGSTKDNIVQDDCVLDSITVEPLKAFETVK
jgi:hypothetical protein